MRTVNVGTFCSGIGAPEVAMREIDGWESAFFSEIEPFPCAVLGHHWPSVPNLGDMTKIDGQALRGTVDVIVAGTPCQAFSVAGARRGLDDARGNLTLKFVGLADAIKPACLLWENVPGVLSDAGNAFGCFLAGLAGEDVPLVAPGGRWSDAGYVLGPRRAIAWRVLDAQYFGLAQRRRRVFLVACPRNGADPREVLFEREGVRRDSAPGREAGQGVAEDVAGSLGAGDGNRGWRNDLDQGAFIPVCFGGNNTSGPIDVATARSASGSASGRMDFESETFAVVGPLCANGKAAGSATQQDAEQGMLIFDTTQVSSKANYSNPKTGDPCHPLAAGAHAPAIAFHPPQDPISSLDGSTHALGCGSGGGQASVALATATQVRRLTPTECERLQGFDGWHTRVPVKHLKTNPRTKHFLRYPDMYAKNSDGSWTKYAADGPRYKAIGNSMAVPCIRWILRRIDSVVFGQRKASNDNAAKDNQPAPAPEKTDYATGGE